MNYQPIIGLEVHIELATASKMFCRCSADYFGKEPNTHTCPICLGLPGALPSPNKVAIEWTQKLGFALSCQVQLSSKFDRKNYFYPDLPKGYQISQYDLPFSQKGSLNIKTEDGKGKKVKITRAHLEEDTGKLLHATFRGKRVTLIDFNRSGVPLVEIVSEPQMNSALEAKFYAQKLAQIVRYLGISDADMEKGSMRIEPNVSLRKMGDNHLPTYKVELKNINSFKFAEQAVNFEIERQAKLLGEGKIPAQETRGWNEQKSITFSQRTKELAHDYRYFPEPDLVPFSFNKEYLFQIKAQLPELPDTKLARFIRQYKLSDYDAEILTRDAKIANYFEEVVKIGEKHKISVKKIANIIINKKPDINSILPAKLVEEIVFEIQKPEIKETELKRIIKKMISDNHKAVQDYQRGKTASVQFLIGQVQKETSGQSDPELVKKLLTAELSS
ncbi:Asp-tRNA(Asn)/Glu-tRNA(Gln) amidotransferase subunit GatB [Candidatus Curtissbacteria bacterium]|nr:Asp-tRNA(Asn)/Glu-tRNA(Gln) amidotransferase subunit GatB [Candidatus Curtissbacteria bacterium]